MIKKDKIKLQIAIYDGFIAESKTHEYASVATHCLVNMKRNYENILKEKEELLETMKVVSGSLSIDSDEYKILQGSIIKARIEDES